MSAVGLLRTLFPSCCVLCRRRSGRDIDLCAQCEQAFARNERACPVCAEPAPAVASRQEPAVCGSCLAKPPPWTMTVAPFAYSRPLTAVVDGLKSGNGLLQARILGKLLAAAVAARYRQDEMPAALVPMPLTRRRLRQRGFNQADLLARVTARELGLPHLGRHLTRVRGGPPQRSLARGERLRNMRGAFAAHGPLPGPRLALIDDVTTTGATVHAATLALRAAGAAEVHVWVAAKTPAQRLTLQ